MNKIIRFSSLLMIFILISCARQSAPSGGPKDEKPPVFINASPDTLSTNVNVNLKEAIINFNEYIILKNYSKNVVVSPSFKTPPTVSPQTLGKKFISIKFNEPLLPNTTYSFNFNDAVQDYNENNILSNFQYVFSTGKSIDSLKIKGRINSSYDFKVPEKIIVGLYKIDNEYKDSIILKNKPYYITRADKNGDYTLNYLAKGKYKLIAFQDKVENVTYDYGKELFAFRNEVVDLNSNQNIDLILFNQKPAYRKPEATSKQNGLISIKIAGATDNVNITPLSKEFKTSLIQKFSKQDSINFWFNPSIDSIKDKSTQIKFAVNYKNKVDTVSVLYTNYNTKHKLELAPLNDKKLAPNKLFKIKSNTPIIKLDDSKIHFFKDTIAIAYKATIDSVNPQIINFAFEKNLDEKFEVNIYPKGIIDIFGEKNDTIAYNINTGTRANFGNLKLTLQNAPKKPFFLQLLKNDKNYTILDEIYCKANTTSFDFNYLEPEEYLFRILIDENENGKWDTGDFFTGKQPEPIYLYPEPIKIRSMWDSAETWILGEANKPVTLNIDNKETERKRLEKGELKEGEERKTPPAKKN